MHFSIFMAIIFAVLLVVTYKPRRREQQADYPKYIAPVRETYHAPPPEEERAFTEEDQAALRRMTAEDRETVTFFMALNEEKAAEEDDSAEITDLRNLSIRRGWLPTSENAVPTLTGTVVQEVPAEEDEAWGPEGPSASYDEWVAEGRTGVSDWEEPDLLRDGVDVTIRKLSLKYFGHAPMPALEPAS